LFWIILGVAVVVVLGLGIGLGVGLSQNKDSSNGSSDEQDGATTGSSSSTSTSTTSEPSSTSQSTINSLACPAANNTLFEVPRSDKMTFLRLCGIDYSGEGGARDLATVWTASVQDCIVNCAGYPGCTACSWGVIPGDNYQQGDNHRCFLKTDLGTPHETRAGWDFAILQ